jgi:hypothetical protein
MNVVKLALVFTALLTGFALPASAGEPSTLGKVQVTAASVDAGSKNAGIKFVIKNDGPSSIDLYRDMLPWNSRGSTTLSLIPLVEGAKPIEQLRLFDDPGETTVKLDAGAEISGVVQLSDCFPEYQKVGGRVEHEVAWSLTLLEPNSKNSRKYSGTVEFLLRKNAK